MYIDVNNNTKKQKNLFLAFKFLFFIENNKFVEFI